MNPFVLVLSVLLLWGGGASAQSNPESQKLVAAVQAFVQAGDRQDAEALDALLDTHYRVVMNQLFGSEEITILDRDTYLTKIKAKEFGGDTRRLAIEEVLITGKSAVVKVKLTGAKLSMRAHLSWVQDAQGAWKLISDTPTII